MRTPVYFNDGELIEKSGDVCVYEMNGVLYLEHGPGHSLWADSEEIKELREQIDDKPNGDCLEIGLGLGVASKLILDKKNVKLLTTVEIDPDVIAIYEKMHPEQPENHKIVNASGMDYLVQTDKTFDFIFLDFYDVIDEETLPEIKDHVEVGKDKLNPGGEIMGWFDPFTPEEFVYKFFDLFKEI